MPGADAVEFECGGLSALLSATARFCTVLTRIVYCEASFVSFLATSCLSFPAPDVSLPRMSEDCRRGQTRPDWMMIVVPYRASRRASFLHV
jgi:hypothetical protein